MMKHWDLWLNAEGEHPRFVRTAELDPDPVVGDMVAMSRKDAEQLLRMADFGPAGGTV